MMGPGRSLKFEVPKQRPEPRLFLADQVRITPNGGSWRRVIGTAAPGPQLTNKGASFAFPCSFGRAFVEHLLLDTPLPNCILKQSMSPTRFEREIRMG